MPKTSLGDRIEKNRADQEGKLRPRLGRFCETFPEYYEMQLVNLVKDLNNRFITLSGKEFRKFALNLTEKLNLSHRMNKTVKLENIFNMHLQNAI